MQKQCKYINEETKEQCNSFALKGSDYCFSHDPKNKDEKQKAVLKGGKALKKVRLNLPVVPIRTPDDVITILEETINLVRSGELPVSNPANTIGFLCSHLLKAYEMISISNKLETIDRLILERRQK